MKILNLFLLLLLVSFISCDEDGYADYDPGETNTQKFAGEWYIVGYTEDGEVAYAEDGADYNLWSTYNTAANDNTFWIDDHGSFFELKSQVEANLSNLTFSGEEDAEEVITGGTVTIRNGKILENAGRAAVSGTVVDSIYFEAEFDWDPGVIYIFGGHERTGFEEDDNPHIN